MDIGTLPRLVTRSAAGVCARCAPTPPARALLAPELDAAAYLARLLTQGLVVDAVRFLAFALPARQGVWWACLAARAATREDAAALAAIAAAEAWVYKPVEANRVAALPAAQAAGEDSFPGYVALGAFWSGGSMAPPGQPELPPDPALSPNAVAAAVLLAGLAAEPDRPAAWYREMIARAIDIANGGDGRRGSGMA